MIQATGIHKSYGSLEVLKGIDIHIAKREIVSIVGASGAGKSTLLHIIGTLDKADRGQLIIDGTEVGKLNDTQLAAFRNQKIGFVFQFHHLLPEFTALENVCIPAYIGGMGKKEATEKALKLLDYLNLTERKDHKPSQLSGGEQQRVAVARALINDPAVVLADAPSRRDEPNLRYRHPQPHIGPDVGSHHHHQGRKDLTYENGKRHTNAYVVMAEGPSFRESGTPSPKHKDDTFCSGDCGSSPQ